MPCIYDDRFEIADSVRRNRQQAREYKEQLDRVTALLCEVMHTIDANFSPDEYPFADIEGLDEWWEEHQEMDRQRRIREEAARLKAEAAEERKRIVKDALQSLTEEQKQAMKEAGVLTTRD